MEVVVYGRRGGLPPRARAVNTTSTSKEEWSRGLSPFFAGPVEVRPGLLPVPALNVENAWQYSKVYADQAGPDGLPSGAWAAWAAQGWRSPRATRFPKGRGARPLYAVHHNLRLGYVASRIYIYIPLYVEGLAASPAGRAALLRLRAERRAALAAGEALALYDYDGYARAGRSFADVALDGRKKMGHAFVLAAFLEDALVAGHGEAAGRCPEVAALVAAGAAVPPLPDLAELRPRELYAPYNAVGAEVYYRPSFLGRLADRALRALLPGGAAGIDWQQRRVNVFGQKVENRLTAFYGDPGARYKYSGRENVARPWADDLSGVLAMVRELLELVTGERYNACLLNLYETGAHSIGKHADDESDLVPGSRIASVSLGATRRFCLEPKSQGAAYAGSPSKEPTTFPAVHGCLITMGGLTQQLYKHWVPPEKGGALPPRVNLTFRRVRAR